MAVFAIILPYKGFHFFRFCLQTNVLVLIFLVLYFAHFGVRRCWGRGGQHGTVESYNQRIWSYNFLSHEN